MTYLFRICFFFNDTATTEIYTYGHTPSLHDALPILEQHIADTPAEHHPKHAVEQQVTKGVGVDPGKAAGIDAPGTQPRGHHEGEQVHQPIPVHGHRPELDGDRIYVVQDRHTASHVKTPIMPVAGCRRRGLPALAADQTRSEVHTSALPSLMRNSY